MLNLTKTLVHMSFNSILIDVYKHRIQAMFLSYCCYLLNMKNITENFINNISHSIVSIWVLTPATIANHDLAIFLCPQGTEKLSKSPQAGKKPW